MKENKKYYISITKHVLLLLFTLGIWKLIWIYKTSSYIKSKSSTYKGSPITNLLLYMFIPFYSIYWTNKSAAEIDKISLSGGLPSSIKIPCLVSAFLASFAPPIIIQNAINILEPADDGFWICQNCTSRNPMNNFVCKKCKSSKFTSIVIAKENFSNAKDI